MPRTIPFHRRVLPWIFVTIFLVMAPALVFYTAGYRWNTKKGIVERNGTLIIDTTPSDATIKLNGQLISEKTPATLQNVAPGTYAIELTKEGFHDWTKTLTIEPERVTFATQISLWLYTEPQALSTSIQGTLFKPQDRNIMIVSQTKDNQTVISQINRSGSVESSTTKNVPIQITQMDWNNNGEKAIVQGTSSGQQGTWLLETSPMSLTDLPNGNYHWNDSSLSGFADGYLLEFEPNDIFQKTKATSDIKDQLNQYAIKTVTETDQYVLTIGEDSAEGFVLEPGHWNFYRLDNEEILLRDGKNWLRVNMSQSPFTSSQAYGNIIKPITIKRETFYLIQDTNEISVWRPSAEPELIHRQSEPIVASGWYTDGEYIYLATKTEIRMIHLDARNGHHQTTIAKFDQIQGAVLLEDTLYITGTKNNQTGLFALNLE